MTPDSAPAMGSSTTLLALTSLPRTYGHPQASTSTPCGLNTRPPEGGFSALSGPNGAGKSKALQLLAARLQRIPELVVGVMKRPQSAPSDLYRELGEVFSVDLSPANLYSGFRALRARWETHVQTHLMHPVLLIDEAQETPAACLNELRLLGSTHFDSRCLLTTVLCGDERLTERFRTRELLPLGSRIRVRLQLGALDKQALRELLEHLLDRAGNPGLVTDGLKSVLVDHSAGNPRVLCTMAAQLLAVGADKDLPHLDEQLFLDVFGRATRRKSEKARS